MRGRSMIEWRLRQLLDAGALARSECPAGFLEFIAPLMEASVVDWERSGAGLRLIVRNPGTLAQFVARWFPQETGVEEGALSRIEGVARFRDSKSLPNDSPEIVVIRAWGNAELRFAGVAAGISDATRQFGLFAFALGQNPSCQLRGRCGIVENPAVFAEAEKSKLNVNLDLAILGGGRCSNRLLEWLAEQGDCQFIHLPDYDPIGLSEYQRIRQRLGERISLYLPPNLGELFGRYSNRNLLANPVAQNLLAKLRSSPLSDVQQVVAWIDQHNGGLEQEALLI